MPTGYTAGIKPDGGVTFDQFVMGCARAFGALITMRDDPLDAPIPDEFKAGDYYSDAVRTAEARVRELEAMTAAEIGRCATEANASRQAERHRRIEEEAAQRAAYESMLAKVRAWNPPTPDHEGLKKFMVEQIRDSIRFDFVGFPSNAPAYQTPAEWHSSSLESARQTLDYARKALAGEIERVRSRNEWVRALRESLRKPAAAGGAS